MKIKMKNAENVNVEQIAQKAGVSCSMVYRVMNGKVNSGNAKHQKVRDLLKATGYTKQRVKKKGNILCVSGIDSQHALELASHVESVVRDDDYEFISICSPRDTIESFIERFNIAGAIFISSEPTEELCIPTVVLNRSIYSGQYSYVDSDEMTALVKALTLLSDHGHQRIGFFNDFGLPGHYPHPRRFFAPYAYEIVGVECDEALIYKAAFGHNGHPEAIADAVDYFQNLPKPPTAILLPGSNYAPCFYQELRTRGLQIPDDISVMAIDDTDASVSISPFLTAIKKPLKEMAKASFDLLLERIANLHTPNRRILIEPKIIERKSVTSIKTT